MIIDNIELSNVRNLTDYSCEFISGINLIYGKNGRGKTTILEAIYSISMGKSFKSGPRKNMIKFDKENFFIKGKVRADGGKTKIISVACSKDQYKITIDKKSVTSIMDLVDVFPVVVMAPENINLIDGSGIVRRNFFDRLISIVDKQYLYSLKKYNKILRQRKSLLFDGKKEMVPLWSDTMAEVGIIIWEKRINYFKKFSELFNVSRPEDLNKIDISVQYSPNAVSSKEDFISQLLKVEKQEILRKTNLYGPHKDDFSFLINRVSAKHFASQGEKKLLLTMLKNTESKFIQKYLGKSPVLLLDDLLAKLDSERGLKIMDMLQENKQAIITSTDRSVIDILNQTNVEINTIHLN